MIDLAVHIIVYGHVQGVFFRASAQARASELDLAGWVRNLSDGTVEIHAEGSKDAIGRFIEWCQKGPPSAKVSCCDVDWVAPQVMSNFKIL